MEGFFKNIKSLIIAVLVILVLLLSYCSSRRRPIPDPEVITKIETKWDTIEREIPIYIPQWRTKVVWEPGKTDTLWRDKKIDTVAILADYFASYTYSDTLKYDSLTLIINDTISKNKIKNRGIKYNLLYPTVTITKETLINRREFYLGAGIGGTTSNFNYIGAEALFRTKRRTALGVGVGLTNEFKLAFNGRLYWKLGK